MIDIIIPSYNSCDTLNQTLASISYQSLSDKVNVCIVDDNSSCNYTELISFYNKFLNIKYLKLSKNYGPGYARQFGIDNTNSEYIVFIDSDDVFNDCYSLEKLYNCIKNNDNDLVVSAFKEEVQNEFVFHNPGFIWLHGKIFRRSFLTKNNIKFNFTRENEDCGFNHFCYNCNPNVSYIDDVTYIWKNNKNSITRKNNYHYSVSGIKNYVYNMVWSIKESYKTNYDLECLSNTFYVTLVSSYYYFLQYGDLFYNENIFSILYELTDFFDICKLSDKEKKNIIKDQLLFCIGNEDFDMIYYANITLVDFIERIKNKLF